MLMLRRSQWGLALALAVCSSAGSAAVINFSDLPDGLPLVSTDVPHAVITNTFEKSEVDLFLPTSSATDLPVLPGTRVVGLLEPASDPFNHPVSDLIRLTAPERAVQLEELPGFFQRIHLTFVSDTTGSVLPQGLPGWPVEDGTMQNVTTFLSLNPAILRVGMQSDVGGPEVPEPSTVFLLGAGLVILATFRLRKV